MISACFRLSSENADNRRLQGIRNLDWNLWEPLWGRIRDRLQDRLPLWITFAYVPSRRLKPAAQA